MKPGALLRDACLGLWVRPGRTALAFMAMASGALALSALLGVLGGLRIRIDRLSDEIGAGNLAILSPEDGAGRRPLTLRQVERLRAGLPGGVISAVRFSDATGPDGQPFRVVMTDENLAAVRGWPATEGRFLDRADVHDRARSLVATVALAAWHGWRPGMDVRVDGRLYRVVGLVQIEETDLSATDAGGALTMGDRALFIPITSAGIRETDGRVDIIFLRAPAGLPVDALQRRAYALAAQPDFGADPVRWVTASVLTAGLRRFSAGIRLVAGAVVGLVLAFGGATLAVLWLMSVRDRVPEIGLRRAVGGSRWDMGCLFLVEGVLLCLCAAVAGLIPAQVVLHLTSDRGEWRPGGASIWIPLLATLLVGGFFSWLPARRAARIEPAQALRET